MLDFKLLLPTTIDNGFSGKRISLWFFYLLTTITLWQSQHHVLAADGGAQSIATIPLDTYSTEATAAVIGIFALWGLSQFIISLIYLAACLKYKALIPLLYLLGILEYGLRAFYIATYKPIETIGDAPGAIMNVPLMIILIAMLLLSLWSDGKPKRQKSH
ncbi:MAG: hypothetical protein QNL17_02070 [Synechococcus sp. ChSW.bin.154]